MVAVPRENAGGRSLAGGWVHRSDAHACVEAAIMARMHPGQASDIPAGDPGAQLPPGSADEPIAPEGAPSWARSELPGLTPGQWMPWQSGTAGAPAETAPSSAPVALGDRGVRTGRWGTGTLVALVLVAAVIGAAAGAGAGAVVADAHSGSTTIVKEVAPGPDVLSGSASIPSILAKVQPAVVSIKATATTSSEPTPFGVIGGSTVEDEGTGMIISPNGVIVTNNHVIAGSTSIEVTLFGQSNERPAYLVGTDPANDIAVLRLKDAHGLPTVRFGDSSILQVGDAVVAIGNALGLDGAPTVTQGIISAEGRTVEATVPTTGMQETLTDMLQTDAAINPGNSGGPLVDASGMVIGMNTATASSTAGNAPAQDIGFAIPVNRIKTLLPAIEAGRFSKPPSAYLGVDTATVTAQIQADYGLAAGYGALVDQVVSGSPAAQSGIEPGDVIVAFRGARITTSSALSIALQSAKPGETVKITVLRGTQELLLSVVLARAPAP